MLIHPFRFQTCPNKCRCSWERKLIECDGLPQFHGELIPAHEYTEIRIHHCSDSQIDVQSLLALYPKISTIGISCDRFVYSETSADSENINKSPITIDGPEDSGTKTACSSNEHYKVIYIYIFKSVIELIFI